MRFPNNPILEEMLVRGGRADLARMPEFELDDLELAQHKVEIHRARLHEDPEELEARAVYRMLTKPQPVAVPRPEWWQRVQAWMVRTAPVLWPYLKVAWALAVARQSAAASRVDITGTNALAGSIRNALSPREIDYRRLSDMDILNL